MIVPTENDLRRAADVLNAGERVAILVGAGALGAADEVIAVADKLGAGVAKALLGKAVLPDDLPFVTGAIGLLGTKPSSDMMNDCDTLLMIGTGFPWSEFLPKDGAARAVQIDIDPAMLSLRYPCEVNLHGSAAETLRLLLPMLEAQGPRVAQADRAMDARMVGNARCAGEDRGASGQSAAGGVGNVAAAARQCDRHQRQRLMRQLVCARLSREARADGVAVGRPGLDGRGGALCDRRQVRPSRPAGDRAGRRRRDADEQHGRAHHHRQISRPLARQAADRLRVQQRGSERGHLGAAGDERQPALRRQPGHPRRPLFPVRAR